MGAAVILCEFAPNGSTRSTILNSALAFAVEGLGELLFVGRQRHGTEHDRELVAVRLGSYERAEAAIQAWRASGALASDVEVRLIAVEPKRPIDNPLMLFP